MLPGNTVSSISITADLLSPDSTVRAPLLDYEQGGVAISDPSQGLQVLTWSCYVPANTNDVMLKPGDGAPVLFAQIAGIIELSFAFDQNMRPVLAYQTLTGIFLYWYDSQAAGYVTTSFGPGRNPRLTLDDKREFNLPNSDVIFAYIRDDGLFYRQQRDRFTIERQVDSGVSKLSLANIGMNRMLRLQFDLK